MRQWTAAFTRQQNTLKATEPQNAVRFHITQKKFTPWHNTVLPTMNKVWGNPCSNREVFEARETTYFGLTDLVSTLVCFEFKFQEKPSLPSLQKFTTIPITVSNKFHFALQFLVQSHLGINHGKSEPSFSVTVTFFLCRKNSQSCSWLLTAFEIDKFNHHTQSYSDNISNSSLVVYNKIQQASAKILKVHITVIDISKKLW